MGKGRQALRGKTVFLDSSVIFSAVNSVSGGSAKVFTLQTVKLTTSKLVLIEVERNVRKKLTTIHLERFFLLVKKLEIMNQSPEATLIEKSKKVIAEKDAVILAEAKKANCDFLLTLDKKHFCSPLVETFLKPQKIFTPKMLFQFLRIKAINDILKIRKRIKGKSFTTEEIKEMINYGRKY